MEQQTENEYAARIIVRGSGIHGHGVYAEHAIAKGTRIIEYVGEKIPTAEGTRREQLTPGHTFIFILDEQFDIDGSVGGNDSKFINHSCSPNAEIEYADGKIWIVASRDIAAGEELTYDYAFDANEPPAPCKCNSKDCKGYINEYANPQQKEEKLAQFTHIARRGTSS